MLNIIVTAILEKEVGEIPTEITRTINILIVIHISIRTIKILIMDITDTIMDRLMDIITDMEKNEQRFKRSAFDVNKAQSKVVILTTSFNYC